MDVKICGIRRYEDARTAIDEGAWALGFIFHKPSPRYLDPEEAGKIVRRLPREALTVGVFVNWPVEELKAAVALSGVRGVQLHGSEDLAYARSIRADLIIKALRAGPSFRPESALEYEGCRILLDADHPALAGGTGSRADWISARKAAELTRVILAGGIGPENAVEAIEAVQPHALDVSSTVESHPGFKDAQKIRRLFDVIREYEGRVGGP